MLQIISKFISFGFKREASCSYGYMAKHLMTGSTTYPHCRIDPLNIGPNP